MERKYTCIGTRKLADGTIKQYTYQKTYKATGVRVSLTDEQKDEVVKKYNEGIKMKRLKADYGISYDYLRDIILEKTGKKSLKE